MPVTQSKSRQWPELVWGSDYPSAVVSRAAADGSLRRIGRGIYVSGRADPRAVVARNWSQIVAREFPGAVIVDRSARALQPRDGRLFVDHPRRRPLGLPGLRIEPREGPGHLETDYPGPEGVWMSSQARGLLDNLAEPNERLLDRQELEEWIEQIIAIFGQARINEIRDEARKIAPRIRRREAFERLDAIVRAALVTGPVSALRSRQLRARAAGAPIDAVRVARFEALAGFLSNIAPDVIPITPDTEGRRVLLPFYEAYFSNYIEGTEFTFDEAAEIVFANRLPRQRPADAHDILGTYRLVSERAWMARTADVAPEFADLLRQRHAILMAGRPDVGPGRFREVNVRAGGTHFVAWQQIEGTLAAGFAAGATVKDPFARAVFAHFLVSEVHPFADGNGRLSRMVLNAELSVANESRIVIPTGYRQDYLGGLQGASNNDLFDGMVRILAFARRWTAQMDFSDRRIAEPLLERTKALVDPVQAIADGIKLTLPSSLLPAG